MNPFEKTPHFNHKIYLIRHGETAWSKSKQHTGRSDIPLTPFGEKEAMALAPRLKELQLKKVFTSPLKRVLRTCELAGFLDQAEPSDDLLEFDYGDFEGLTISQIREKIPDWSLFKDGVPNGETFEEASKRADHILNISTQIDGDVAFFASGHISRIIGARWVNFASKQAQFLALSTASISILGYEHEWRAIQRWNDLSHLGK